MSIEKFVDRNIGWLAIMFFANCVTVMGVVGFINNRIVMPPRDIADFLFSKPTAVEVLPNPYASPNTDFEELLNELAPLYTLPNGEPLHVPEVRVDARMADAHPEADGLYACPANIVFLPPRIRTYAKSRQSEISKHELIHAWQCQAGLPVQNESESFFRKALEVGLGGRQ